MQNVIAATLVSSEHGYHDYDVQGLPKVHRACVGHNLKKGDIFNVYCEDGVKIGATWSVNLEQSLSQFAATNPSYQILVSQAKKGEVGRHDWAIGDGCEDGFPVFVDDRQLAYRQTQDLAQAYALEIIARLQADGDYRLNDKPAGFLPPPLSAAS